MIKQITSRIDAVIQLLRKSNELHEEQKSKHVEPPKKMKPSDAKFLTVDQVAARYGYNPTTIRRWVDLDILIPTKIGGRDFFEETAIHEFIMGNGFDKFPRRRRKKK